MSDSTRRDIELRIRATNLSNQQFAQVSQSIQQLKRDIDQEVQAASRGKIATDELRSSMTRLEQAANALRNLSVLVDRFKNLEGNVKASQAQFDSSSQKLAAYRAHLETLDKTTTANERSLTNFVKAVQSAEKSLTDNRNRLAEVDTELKRLGVDTKNLADAENQLRVQADAVGLSLGKANEALLNNAKNSRIAKEEAKAHAAAMQTQADAGKRLVAQATELLSSMDKEDQARTRLVMNARRYTQEFVKNEQDKKKAAQEAFNARIEEIRQTNAAMRTQANAESAAAVQQARRANQFAAGTLGQQFPGGVQRPVPGQPGGGAAPGVDPRSREAQRLGILSPYQWQQLSFQINDVITQLASGTSLTQTLSQQGGQIAQIFTTQLGALLRFLPQVAVAGAALAVAIGTINRAFADIQSIREFNGLLRVNADGASYNAVQITTLRRQVQDLGMSWEDTGAVMKIAINAGFRPEALKGFAEAVQNVVDVTGEKAPEAAKKLADAFTGGWESLRKFNQETNFLTVAEYEQVRALYQSGNAAEGAARAWRVYRGVVKEAADDAVSPFTRLTRELSAAWRELLATLARSETVQGLVRTLTSLAEAITASVKALDDAKAAFNDPKFQMALKIAGYVAMGPVGLARAAVAGATSAVGAVTAPPEPAATGVLPAPGAGQERLTIGPRVKLDSEDLQQLVAVLREATKQLPEGVARAEITSGRASRASGTTNHPEGHAVDLVLIDEQGRRVPGFMGVDSTGKYTAFAVVAKGVVQRMFPNRVSEFESGTQYADEDAGHFGFRAGGARGAKGPLQTPDELRAAGTVRATNAQKELREEVQKTLDADQTANRELILRRKNEEELARLRADPKYQAAGDDAIKAEAARLTSLKRIELERQDRAEAAKERVRVITDGSHYAEIRQAGETAYQAAVARGEKNHEELQRIRLDAESEHRAKMTRSEKERNDLETLQNTLNGLARQNELKNVTDIEAKVRAVTTQYERLGQLISKFSREFPNVDVSNIRQQAAAQQGEAEQRAGAEARLTQLNTLQSDRIALVNTYNTLLEKGVITQTEFEDKTKAAFERTTPAITKAAEEFQKFLTTADKIDPTKLELYNAKIKEIRASSEYISPLWKKIKETIEESFTSGLATAFNTVGEAVGGLIAKTKSWGDVLAAVKTAAMQFFAQLLKDIALAILKYEALKLVSSFTGGKGGGIGDIISSIFGGGSKAAAGTIGTTATGAATELGSFSTIGGATLFHRGGVAGRGGGQFGYANPAWFDSAPRYHRGAVAGLGSDEYAAVLRRNEEVLTEDNPRHVFNGGGSPEINIRSVLVDNPDRIPEAMMSVSGERAIMATVQKNMATIRQGVKG